MPSPPRGPVAALTTDDIERLASIASNIQSTIDHGDGPFEPDGRDVSYLRDLAARARASLEALESGERKQPRISITYDRASSMYVIGDEDGEFARVAAWTDTWHYVTDLLTGPGTLSAGSLFDRTINPELQGTVARLPDNQGAEG